MRHQVGEGQAMEAEQGAARPIDKGYVRVSGGGSTMSGAGGDRRW